MKISTAHNHLRRLQGVLSEVYAMGRFSGRSHKQTLNQSKARVWNDPGLARCPGWVKAALQQHSQHLFNDLYKPIVSPSELDKLIAGEELRPFPYVRWFHRGPDGTLYTTWDQMPQEVRDAQTFTSAHRWNHKREVEF